MSVEVITPSGVDKYLNKLFEGMPFQTYIDLEGFIHSSDLKLLQQSINHWLSKSDYAETHALKLGTLGHTLLLEMDKLTERYLVMPKVDARTVKGKEQKLLAEEQAQNEGKILISQEDLTQALGWRENIMKNPVTSSVFMDSRGKNEVSGFFKHPEFDGINGAFRVDKLLEKEKIAIDLKIMQSAHPFAFASSVRKFRYDLQAAFYLTGLREITGDDYDFLFVVCEKSNHHNVQTYRLDEESLEVAREHIRLIISKYLEYKESDEHQQNRLSGYYDGIQTLNIQWFN